MLLNVKEVIKEIEKDAPGIDIKDFIKSLDESIVSWDTPPDIELSLQAFRLLGAYKSILKRYEHHRKVIEAFCDKKVRRSPYVRVIGYDDESGESLALIDDKILYYSSIVEDLESITKSLIFWKDIYKAKQFS